MLNKFGIGFISLALFSVQSAHSQAAPDFPLDSKTHKRMSDLFTAYEQEDCPKVVKRGRALVDRPDDFLLSDKLTAAVYDLVVICEMEGRLLKPAYAHALTGTRLDASSDMLWMTRLSLEIDNDDLEASIKTIEAMTQGRGRALNAIPAQWTSTLLRQLKSAKRDDLRARFLAVLTDDSYAPEQPFTPIDWFRQDYAGLLHDAGKTDRAKTLVNRITEPRTLIRVLADQRFRGVLPVNLDVRAAVEKKLEENRETLKQHPELLEGLIEVSDKLRWLGRPQEALDILATAAPKIDEQDGFADKSDRLPWWWDERARNYAALGKFEEALDSFRKGGSIDESGNLNVSQLINLAHLQIKFGQGEDALDTLKAFDDPKRKGSPYGEMEMRQARGCAQVVVGHPEKAASDVSYARSNARDNPEALTSLLICVGDMNGAAASLISRLDNPEERPDALLQLSDYDPPVADVPLTPQEKRLPEIKARPDVKAAIERAGGIFRIHLQNSSI